jgi:mono/diheme cytochrome c family protein
MAEWCRGVIVGLVIALAGSATLRIDAGQAKTAKDGVYADSQARRGDVLYGQQCAACHAADLRGSGAPALAGPDFLVAWDNRSVDELVEKIASTMPSSAPGSLSRIQATDLVAFMLQSNKFPAGSAELDSAPETLQTIKLVK